MLTEHFFVAAVGRAREVYAPGCAGHSPLFEGWLRDSADACANTRFTGIHVPTVNRFDFAALSPSTRFRNIFASADSRASYSAGRVELLAMSYFDTWRWLESTARFDLALIHVSPPDARGECSFGIAADFTPAVWPRASAVFAHINPLMPRSDGPTIPLARIDAAIEAECALLEVADAAPDATLDAAAANVAALLDSAATLQLGLGRLQGALLPLLRNRRGLSLHAGMVTGGLVALAESGALAGATAGVALGSAEFYARVPPMVRFRPVGTTHDPRTLLSLPRFTAVNSALAIDLHGQVNGEWIDGVPISGAGGLVDFARGARHAPNGQSVIALKARDRHGRSAIVPHLGDKPPSLGRHDADVFVTEFGAAHVRTLDADARSEALIAIAAPEHRAPLAAAWAANRGRASNAHVSVPVSTARGV